MKKTGYMDQHTITRESEGAVPIGSCVMWMPKNSPILYTALLARTSDEGMSLILMMDEWNRWDDEPIPADPVVESVDVIDLLDACGVDRAYFMPNGFTTR